MKYTIKQFFYALTAVALLTSCDAEFDNPVGDTSSYSRGSADFSTFVALGDSLTAGYADGALYPHGQESSYGAILAQQFALVGGGAFTQPLMPVGATGSLNFGGQDVITDDRYLLFPTGDPANPVGPARLSDAAPSLVISTDISTRLTGPFNNMGVPGAKAYHLGIPGYGASSLTAIGDGTANPYFSRFSSSDATNMVTDAAGQVPSFFVLWIGNNDILSYATGGGVGTDQTGNSDVLTYDAGDITDPGFFTSGGTGAATGLPGYPAIVAALSAGGAKGVLINIPDVSTIPYFTTVPYNAIPMTADEAAAANAGFATYNGTVNAILGATNPEAIQRQIVFVEGQNPVVILDEDLTDLTGASPLLLNMRQATINDFIVLPTASKLGEDAGGGFLWGISAPLLDADVLQESEVTAVETARAAYNATILAAADASADLLYYDASAMLTELNDSGIFYGTGGITSTFATGGGFSLDGVHPTARGYAVISNAIIDVINTGFSANIPKVDPGAYTTVFYQ